MFCKSCGKQIDDDSKFCSFCGTKQNISITASEIEPKHFDINLKKETAVFQNQEKIFVKNEYVTEQKNIVIEKYDLTYRKEIGATIFGAIFLFANAIFLIFFRQSVSDYGAINNINELLGLFSIIFRIVSTIWVTNIAKRQNRNSLGWGIFAFFFPAIALIVIGSSKKLKTENYISSNNSKNTYENSNLTSKNEIVLFPNPASTTLNINGLDKTDKTIFLTNIVGETIKTIQTDENNSVVINIKNLDSGVYFIKINNCSYRFVKS